MHEANGRVEIPVEAAVLRGNLHVPRAASGIVVFAHGSGSSRLSPRNRMVAAYLRAQGLGTLLFDLLTTDEETYDATTGRYRFDIGLLAPRLAAVTDWLAGREPRASLGYFGASTGAAAALVAAVHSAIPIRAVVSRGGRPDLADEALERVRAATLLIVGGNDPQVLSLNEAALERMRCEKQLAIVPGATHLFAEPGALEEVARLAAEWFVEHLRGPAAPGGDRV